MSSVIHIADILEFNVNQKIKRNWVNEIEFGTKWGLLIIGGQTKVGIKFFKAEQVLKDQPTFSTKYKGNVG